LALVVVELFLRLLGFGYNLIHKAPVDTGADYRIYCVGESTTWGIGASDPIRKGYPRQLENMLNERHKGIKTQCFFEQAIGQNTSEILLKLPRYIRKYRPQLVILMAGTNNWWNMDGSNILLVNQSQISQSTLRTLIFLDQFRTWTLFKNAMFTLGFYEERWDHWFPRGETGRRSLQAGDDDNRLIFAKLAEHDISEMIRICQANKIKVILCNYPMASGVHLRNVQNALAKKYQIPLVDNYSIFQKLSDLEKYLWPKDHWHPNDRGYAVVARNIYDCIVKNGFIQERKVDFQ